MHTNQTHTYSTPTVREILPVWAIARQTVQRERVIASLLARP
jgi:hypothetical protein